MLNLLLSLVAALPLRAVHAIGGVLGRVVEGIGLVHHAVSVRRAVGRFGTRSRAPGRAQKRPSTRAGTCGLRERRRSGDPYRIRTGDLHLERVAS